MTLFFSRAQNSYRRLAYGKRKPILLAFGRMGLYGRTPHGREGVIYSRPRNIWFQYR